MPKWVKHLGNMVGIPPLPRNKTGDPGPGWARCGSSLCEAGRIPRHRFSNDSRALWFAPAERHPSYGPNGRSCHKWQQCCATAHHNSTSPSDSRLPTQHQSSCRSLLATAASSLPGTVGCERPPRFLAPLPNSGTVHGFPGRAGRWKPASWGSSPAQWVRKVMISATSGRGKSPAG